MADGTNDWAHDLLRTLVLKTNSYFPFRYSNRWPYALALKRMVAAVRPYPEVRALYIRHGLTSLDWTPGLSDIDQSVILERGLPAGREFDVVDSLHASYRRLKRWFPMLGELEILGADDLNAWLRATSEAPAPRSWTLLYGTPAFEPDSDHSPHWRSRALKVAMWIYLDMLPPCLAKRDSYLQRVDVLRRVKKIDRLLRPNQAEKGEKEAPIDPHAHVPVLVAHAAKWLETAVALSDCSACAGKRDTTHPPEEIAGVRSALTFGGKFIVTLPNGLAPDTITAITAGKQWDRPPLPMAESVFAYMARRYDPYGYAALLRGGEISFGADPLEGVPPPGRAEFAAYLLSRFDHTLVFTRGEEMFPASESPVVAELGWGLNRLMGIRLLVEKGWVSADQDEIDAQWRREFPERAQALDELRLIARRAPRAARQEAFALFRSLANEVRDAVTAMETPA